MRQLAIAMLLVAACSSSKQSNVIAKDDAAKLLLDRNWIDVLPETERDRLHVYRFVPAMGGGVFQDRTIFKGTFELFQFAVEGDRILFNLLETHEKVSSEFVIENVDGPHDFDLKLTIKADPRGPSVYYGWRRETGDAAKLDAQLGAHLAH